jgi:hypothetical protein
VHKYVDASLERAALSRTGASGAGAGVGSRKMARDRSTKISVKLKIYCLGGAKQLGMDGNRVRVS